MGWGRPIRRVNAVTAGFGTSCSCTVYLSTWQTMTLALWMGAGAGLGGLGQRDGRTTQHTRRGQGQEKPLGKGEGGCGYLCPSRCPWTGAGDPPDAKLNSEGQCPAARRAWQRPEGSPKLGQRGVTASGSGTGPPPAARHARGAGPPGQVPGEVLAMQHPSTAHGGALAGARSLQHLRFPPAALNQGERALPAPAPRQLGGVGGCLPDTGEGLRAITP